MSSDGEESRVLRAIAEIFKQKTGEIVTKEEMSRFYDVELTKFELIMKGRYLGDYGRELQRIRTTIYGTAVDVVYTHTDLLFHSKFLGAKGNQRDTVLQQVTHHATSLCAKVGLGGIIDHEFGNACAVLGYAPPVIEVWRTGFQTNGPEFHCHVPDSVVPTVLPVLCKLVVQENVPEPSSTTSLRRAALVTPRYSMSLEDMVFDTTCREDFAPGMVSKSALLNIALCMTSAIKVFHQAGYCHGDIKPGNIMLGPNNTLVLIDYGSACAYGEKISESSAYGLNARTVGSLHYDLMCLGTVMCELLTAYRVVEKLSTQRDVLNALQEPRFASHILAPVILLMFTSNNIDEVWRAATTAVEKSGVNPLHLANLQAIWKW